MHITMAGIGFALRRSGETAHRAGVTLTRFAGASVARVGDLGPWGTALSLALAVAAGGTALHTISSGSVPIADERSAAIDPSRQARIGTLDRAVRPTGRAALPAPPATQVTSRVTILIVESEERASALMEIFNHPELALMDEPSFQYEVVVIDSPEREERFLWAFAAADSLRGAMGLPPLRVLDLRPDIR